LPSIRTPNERERERTKRRKRNHSKIELSSLNALEMEAPGTSAQVVSNKMRGGKKNYLWAMLEIPLHFSS